MSHLGAAVSANSFVDLINHNGDVLKTLTEPVETPSFDLLKLLVTPSGCSSAGIKC